MKTKSPRSHWPADFRNCLRSRRHRRPARRRRRGDCSGRAGTRDRRRHQWISTLRRSMAAGPRSKQSVALLTSSRRARRFPPRCASSATTWRHSGAIERMPHGSLARLRVGCGVALFPASQPARRSGRGRPSLTPHDVLRRAASRHLDRSGQQAVSRQRSQTVAGEASAALIKSCIASRRRASCGDHRSAGHWSRC